MLGLALVMALCAKARAAGSLFQIPKSLNVLIGFGANEGRGFRQNYSQFGTSAQFSSAVCWHQIEPHAHRYRINFIGLKQQKEII